MAKRSLIFLCFIMLIAPVIIQAEPRDDDPPPWAEQQQPLIAADDINDPADPDYFGRVMALDGDTVAVAAPKATVNGQDADGAVYIFQRSGTTWIEQAKITSPDPQGQMFGSSLALKNGTLVISNQGNYIIRSLDSEPYPNYDAKIYIYTGAGSSWTLQTTINTPPTDTSTSFFGTAVALSGDGNRLAVNFDRGIGSVGLVYLYQRNNDLWELETILTSPVEGIPEFFGMDLKFNAAGDILMIHNAENALYIFQQMDDVWAWNQTLYAAMWPYSMAISPDGKTIAIGTPFETNNGQFQAGKVAIYTHSNEGGSDKWEYNQTVLPLDLRANMGFGGTVQLDNNRLLVIASDYPTIPNTIIGEAYIFRQIDSIWTQEAILVSFDIESFDSEFSILGISTGLDGDYAVLGSWNGETGHSTAAAYKIPEVDQGTSDNIIADAGTGLILLPQAGAPSGYAALAVALKTRPTQNVYLRLKTKKDSRLLLDNGGEAVPQLILQFTRDNWDIPQSIRVRGTSDVSGELTGKIKYKIKAGSAIEYLFVTPPPVMLTIPADHFGLTSPMEGSVIEAPYEFTWRPYDLATQYLLKIKSGEGYKYKQQVNPAGSCTVDLCTFKPDFNLSPLPENVILKWRVIAKDQQAAYKKKTPWVTFTSH